MVLLSSLHAVYSVDAEQKVHIYDLHQQAALTSPGLWETFAALACPLRKHKTTVSFFSATPRGGGVALMRHALIRVWSTWFSQPPSCTHTHHNFTGLVGLDVKWYVPQGDSAVFDVTKRKFHNVLQGVAPEDTVLRPEDRKLFERWTEWNYNKYWAADGDGDAGQEDAGRCPVEADVVVIDDPQRKLLLA